MLMKKLMEIDAACSPQRKVKEQEEREKNLDEFTIEKRRVADFIREIRLDIKERDRLYTEFPNDRAKGVTKGAEIRQKIKEVTERAEDLEKKYKAKHKKLKQKQKLPGIKIPEEKLAKDANRKQVIDLMWQHLKELERQEKTIRATDQQRIYESVSESDGERDVTGLGISDIDDPRFEVLRLNDQEIDEMLDITLQGVKRLKQIAIELGGAIEESNELITEVQQMAEVTLGNLETVNGQLKKTLQAVRSTADFCCDIILCCLILGIATAIYFVVTGNKSN